MCVGTIHYLDPCGWPFGENANVKIEGLISEYRNIEKDNHFDKKIYKMIRKKYRCEGDTNLTLKLALLRLEYFKAVDINNISGINKVSRKAFSLIKDSHPNFNKIKQNKQAKDFLLILSNSKITEELRYDWSAFFICCLAGGIFFIFASCFGGFDIPLAFGFLVFGGIVGGMMYNYFLINFLHAEIILNYDIPFVPLIS